jgi:hypothetical protein
VKFVVSVKLKVHNSARDRLKLWAQQHGKSFADLKAALEADKGEPAGAIRIGNGRWIWAVGGTFLSYVLKDEPVALFGRFSLPFLVRRYAVVTDIFAL